MSQLWHEPCTRDYDKNGYHGSAVAVNSFVAVAYVPSVVGGRGTGVAKLNLRLHGVYLMLPPP